MALLFRLTQKIKAGCFSDHKHSSVSCGIISQLQTLFFIHHQVNWLCPSKHSVHTRVGSRNFTFSHWGWFQRPGPVELASGHFGSMGRDAELNTCCEVNCAGKEDVLEQR